MPACAVTPLCTRILPAGSQRVTMQSKGMNYEIFMKLKSERRSAEDPDLPVLQPLILCVAEPAGGGDAYISRLHLRSPAELQ
ncbi:hypothetical protein PBY51_004618 [Eleginops maclovinus]|uniref:Uncharacterized protein n=1 Tax=Eleginops maclovinus TaxID=56733 RepID=A0AAN7Y6H3_ELEMC|nr:hypothetical protein PBY51_004618 [Eleginops maclovinus]